MIEFAIFFYISLINQDKHKAILRRNTKENTKSSHEEYRVKYQMMIFCKKLR